MYLIMLLGVCCGAAFRASWGYARVPNPQRARPDYMASPYGSCPHLILKYPNSIFQRRWELGWRDIRCAEISRAFVFKQPGAPPFHETENLSLRGNLIRFDG